MSLGADPSLDLSPVGKGLLARAELQEIFLLAAIMLTSITTISFLFALITSTVALPQNFEDLDLVADQPVGEVSGLLRSLTHILQVVDVNQADPQSNAIHVAHNIPKDSDIKIVQTNPFNTTVHISLNVGTGTKVCMFTFGMD